MQDAYVVEAQKLGKWSEIGYTGPGSNSASGAASAVFTYTESVTVGSQWNATPKSKLNDCNTDNKWILGAYLDNTNEGQANVAYKAGQASGKTGCLELTPSFTQLTSGRSTSGS